jgi:Domain of unknown function (DUF6457)
MDEWIRRLCDELDVPIEDVDTDAVLDLARDAAHQVDRPAAPVTTYIVGYAAARLGGGERAVGDATRRAVELARTWEPTTGA